MSRARLKELCLELPLFPVTSVGSFPKPDYLTQARSDLQKGKITAAELRRLAYKTRKPMAELIHQALRQALPEESSRASR